MERILMASTRWIDLSGFSVVINSSAPADIAAATRRASIALSPNLHPSIYAFFVISLTDSAQNVTPLKNVS